MAVWREVFDILAILLDWRNIECILELLKRKKGPLSGVTVTLVAVALKWEAVEVVEVDSLGRKFKRSSHRGLSGDNRRVAPLHIISHAHNIDHRDHQQNASHPSPRVFCLNVSHLQAGHVRVSPSIETPKINLYSLLYLHRSLQYCSSPLYAA